jgi:nucleoside-diphosphate-sugar epimerase
VHVLVTGARGFIGSHLCNALLSKNVKVTGLSYKGTPTNEGILTSSSTIASNQKQFEIINCDIVRQSDLITAFEQLDHPIECILHTAGKKYRKEFSSEVYFQNNFIGTLNLLECCRIFGIKKLVLSSTIAVYGHHANFPLGIDDPPFEQLPLAYLPIDEMHEVKPFPADFYAISKYFSEQLCKFYYDVFGVSCIILRLSRVYGPSLNSGPVFNAIKKALFNENFDASDDASSDFVFIDDVVKANIAAFEKIKKQFEVYNIGSGQEITLYKLCSKIIELCHSSSELRFRLKPKSRFSLEISKAIRDMCYKPTTLEKALIQYIEYVKHLPDGPRNL